MKINQLKMGTILSYVSIFVSVIIQLIYTPIMLRLLGQSEYGVYTLSASIISYLNLFSFGFSGAYMRFYSRYKVEKQKNKIKQLNGLFLLLFFILSIIAIIAGVILVLNTNVILGSKLVMSEMKIAKTLMKIMIVNIVLTFPSSLFNSIIASQEKYLFQRGLDLLCKILNPILALPLLMYGKGAVAITCITTALTMFNLFLSMWYAIKLLHIKFSFYKMDIKLFAEIGMFSFWIFLNMIIDQINWNVDKFILGRVCGSLVVAVYGVAAQINSLYLMFSTAISSVFGPRVNCIVAENRDIMNKDLTNLFVKVGRIQFIVLWLLASGITFFGKHFICLWAGKEYESAYYVLLFLIWPGVITSSQNLGIEIQRAKNQHQFRSIVYLFMAVFNIIITIPLCKTYGAIGAAMGTANSLVIANIVIMNLYYHKKIGLDMTQYWKSICRLVTVLLPVAFVGYILNRILVKNNWIELICGIVLYSIIYCVLMYLFGLNSLEKKMILDIKNKIIREKRENVF